MPDSVNLFKLETTVYGQHNEPLTQYSTWNNLFVQFSFLKQSQCYDTFALCVCLYQCMTKVLESELKPSFQMLFSTEIFSKEWDRNNVLAMAICFVRFKGAWSVLCRVMQHMVICWTNQNMCLSCFISNLFCSIFFASLLKLKCTTSGFCFKSTVCVYQARGWAIYHYFNTKCKLVWLSLVYIWSIVV